MSMSFKTNRPQKQLSYKSIRPEMLLSIKSERLLVRKIFKKCLAKKVDSVSKSLMGENGLTGDLTGSPDG
ncbi:MAG: hypothetical protein E7013_05380 [Alphaproteobacteria bacterium]|nr:hypothetical protein [Alphaproteobacteria bacterium]